MPSKYRTCRRVGSLLPSAATAPTAVMAGPGAAALPSLVQRLQRLIVQAGIEDLGPAAVNRLDGELEAAAAGASEAALLHTHQVPLLLGQLACVLLERLDGVLPADGARVHPAAAQRMISISSAAVHAVNSLTSVATRLPGGAATSNTAASSPAAQLVRAQLASSQLEQVLAQQVQRVSAALLTEQAAQLQLTAAAQRQTQEWLALCRNLAVCVQSLSTLCVIGERGWLAPGDGDAAAVLPYVRLLAALQLMHQASPAGIAASGAAWSLTLACHFVTRLAAGLRSSARPHTRLVLLQVAASAAFARLVLGALVVQAAGTLQESASRSTVRSSSSARASSSSASRSSASSEWQLAAPEPYLQQLKERLGVTARQLQLYGSHHPTGFAGGQSFADTCLVLTDWLKAWTALDQQVVAQQQPALVELLEPVPMLLLATVAWLRRAQVQVWFYVACAAQQALAVVRTGGGGAGIPLQQLLQLAVHHLECMARRCSAASSAAALPATVETEAALQLLLLLCQATWGPDAACVAAWQAVAWRLCAAVEACLRSKVFASDVQKVACAFCLSCFGIEELGGGTAPRNGASALLRAVAAAGSGSLEQRHCFSLMVCLGKLGRVSCSGTGSLVQPLAAVGRRLWQLHTSEQQDSSSASNSSSSASSSSSPGSLLCQGCVPWLVWAAYAIDDACVAMADAAWDDPARWDEAIEWLQLAVACGHDMQTAVESCTPVGAGQSLRRAALEEWLQRQQVLPAVERALALLHLAQGSMQVLATEAAAAGGSEDAAQQLQAQRDAAQRLWQEVEQLQAQQVQQQQQREQQHLQQELQQGQQQQQVQQQQQQQHWQLLQQKLLKLNDTVSNDPDLEALAAASSIDELLQHMRRSPVLQALPAQLQAFAAGLWAALPQRVCCNNPRCANLAGPSELTLVAGKGRRCARCHCARYCSQDCQAAHWPHHRPVCRRLKRAAAAVAAEQGGQDVRAER